MSEKVVRDTLISLWEKIDGLIITHGGGVDNHVADSLIEPKQPAFSRKALAYRP